MKNVGLFFGSFNPVHVGHLILANHIVDTTNMDEVWMVVSPHNPHKSKSNLLADHHRLALVNIAVEDNYKLKASNIEFDLPKPSYTVFTLQVLKEKYPDSKFTLIMGEDNLRTLHKWKNYEYIIENHQILVYPRVLTILEAANEDKSENDFEKHDNVILLEDVPLMKISSSFIRNAIKNGQDVRYLLTEKVYHYLDEMNFYK
ncbi:nicotinate-nucleotide adenylyltransferase [Paracrocinitomix mangrovi]|uniref:nicotinate (nicotinamide) nucleotide adenylyltransferase n=1 Tax=Paracrocinitomix mangrovi TaxID=2862509 RepID=UPI001C8D3077|nr:nicotinate (nicotinamide) nucleotide adenylyltransferase [Paracrocinitomix mangrovi]UKN00803.1 nicotinate-nucleotide adenylyltransferase [Paracrocinitomix mangrovi]